MSRNLEFDVFERGIFVGDVFVLAVFGLGILLLEEPSEVFSFMIGWPPLIILFSFVFSFSFRGNGGIACWLLLLAERKELLR